MNSMLQIGNVVDNKYKITGLCSDSGGMGTVLFVDSLSDNLPFKLVLKYCKDDNPESIQRFCRETLYLKNFEGNLKISQIYDSNLEHNPPYFVMQYYPDGDLTKICDDLINNVEYQEIIFHKMIDCISELHKKGCQHRDIKPQNFLRNGEDVIVSDLGLAKVVGAGTTFTVSNTYGGTDGYIPPEFYSGDFKNASPPSDIFMLGKSFYFLLTTRDVRYIDGKDVHPSVFHIIQKCCDSDKKKRYQNLFELKKDLDLAFAVILDRESGIVRAKQMLSQIITLLNSENSNVTIEVVSLLDILPMLGREDINSVIEELPKQFFEILSQSQFEDYLPKFLDTYDIFVEDRLPKKSFEYAETVADYMKIIFEQSSSNQTKTTALKIAIKGAKLLNRYTAMGICSTMIYSIHDESLGIMVASLISSNAKFFIADKSRLDISKCQNKAIRIAVEHIQNR